jgi:hypothetical protein
MGLGNSLQTAQAAAGGGGVGGWVELARTTLGSAGDTISVTGLADKRYYMTLIDSLASGVVAGYARVNTDSGSNYSRRRSEDGGSDVTNVNSSYMNYFGQDVSGGHDFTVGYLANKSDKEKLSITNSVWQNTAGAGNAPHRLESTGKWTNTSNAIASIQAHNIGAGSFNTGSEVVVLGWDPEDTHTTNFWEELASVSGDGTSTTLDSGTITAKKYLWVQAYGSATSMDNMALRFNSDTGSNYNRRLSLNGVEETAASQTYLRLGSGASTGGSLFGSGFIINNSANEKLLTSHWCRNRSTGAGNAPERFETVGKWANTSSQITSIQLIQSTSNNWDSDSIIKVWGSN